MVTVLATGCNGEWGMGNGEWGVEAWQSTISNQQLAIPYARLRELQQINYPILWGGHPARPVHRTQRMPIAQEIIGYFKK